MIPEFTKITSVCEKCIAKNNEPNNIARGSVRQYCTGYCTWNLNGKLVFGPKSGKNICPFE